MTMTWVVDSAVARKRRVTTVYAAQQATPAIVSATPRELTELPGWPMTRPKPATATSDQATRDAPTRSCRNQAAIARITNGSTAQSSTDRLALMETSPSRPSA
jgi:hypothetical protein